MFSWWLSVTGSINRVGQNPFVLAGSSQTFPLSLFVSWSRWTACQAALCWSPEWASGWTMDGACQLHAHSKAGWVSKGWGSRKMCMNWEAFKLCSLFEKPLASAVKYSWILHNCFALSCPWERQVEVDPSDLLISGLVWSKCEVKTLPVPRGPGSGECCLLKYFAPACACWAPCSHTALLAGQHEGCAVPRC